MNATIDQVGQTAFIIAAWRVAATERVAPFISDHIAHIFLDEAAADLARAATNASPLTQHLVCLRTRYLDDRLAELLDRGVRQVILLGAGLDTRPLRFARPAVRFFEVDRAAVLDFKATRLAHCGYVLQSRLVPGDYLAPDWWADLLAAGLDPQLPTFVIWEGNSMYIPEEAIVRLLSQLRSQLPHLIVAFDYLSRRLLQKAAGQTGGLVASFAALDAPWITGFDDISLLAREVGLQILDDGLLVRWGERLRPPLPLDARLLDDYSICTLGQGVRS